MLVWVVHQFLICGPYIYCNYIQCEYLIWLKTKQYEDKGQRNNNREQNHMPKHETGMLDTAIKLHTY